MTETMNLNDVKAGKYQLVAVRWDQITSKPGEPLDYIRHRRGAIVDLTAEDAKRLVAAGAVVKPGQLEKTKAEQARALAERAAAEYQAILAGLPEDVRAEIAPRAAPSPGTATGKTEGSGSGDQSSAQSEGPKPGTAEYILNEVGNNPALAQVALDEENAQDKPRKGLVTKLTVIIGESDPAKTSDGGQGGDA